MNKKLMTCLAIAALFSGPTFAKTISPEEALLRLQTEETPFALNTRSGGTPQLKKTWKTLKGENALYLYSRGTDQGFMILSADDMVTPILGYSNTGSLDSDNLPPAFVTWLDGYAAQMQYLRNTDIRRTDNPATRADVWSSWTPIVPLVKTVWDQTSPFNNLCPEVPYGSSLINCPTGCVATAMAQVMNYFQYPEHGNGTISYKCETLNNRELTLDLSSLNFDWANMINSYNGNYTETQATAVAQLMQATGYSMEMSYNLSNSGAVSAYIPGALINYFNYDKACRYVSRTTKTYNEWATLIYDNLKNVGPVIYDGDTANQGGHSFVCDGYQGNGYFHFNWGWGGASDGYYLLDLLNPAAIGVGGAYGGFNFNQDIVLGISKPKAGSQIQETIQLSGSIKGATANNSYMTLQISGNHFPGYRYYGPDEVKFDIGIELSEANNPASASYIIAQNNDWYQQDVFSPLDSGHILLCDGSYNYPYPRFSLSKLNLKDGVKYKVTAAAKPQGQDWRIVPAGIGCYNYFYITKAGTKYTYENFNLEELTCDQLTLLSPLYDGNAATFKIILTNNTSTQLSRSASFYLLNKENTPIYSGESILVTLEPGTTYSKDWTTELKRVADGKLNKATEFYPALYDIDSETYYYISKTPVTMQPNPGAPEYKVTEFKILNAIGQEDDIFTLEDSSNIQISTTVNVTKGFFSYPVEVLILLPDDGQYLSLASYLLDLQIIEAGNSGTYTQTISYPDANPDETYYLGVAVNLADVLASETLKFRAINNEAGIEGITATENDIKFLRDSSGQNLFIFGDIEIVEVYSVNGMKLSVPVSFNTSGATLSLSSLGKGIVIISAIDKTGIRHTIKFAL